jgi:hypothetical protein
LLLAFVAFTHGVVNRRKHLSTSHRAQVHKVLNGLLALRSGGLDLVEGCVHDLALHSLEFTEFLKVDFDVFAISEEFSNKRKQVK